ncbi:MAG: Uncharacterized protein G01um101456_383 [Parcubacteria group bacterium Gr01-1014_56]|nr:MAG: Uncharacterized protein G01um101456_383 [Parcubacteria group bacterium Gr01-1014_56]
MARQEKSGVEKLKNRLYERGSEGKEKADERAALSPSDLDIPRSWRDIEVPQAPAPVPTPSTEEPLAPPPLRQHIKPPMSFATKFFLGSMIFFVGAFVVSAGLFFGGVNTTSPQNIDVQVIAPSLIDGGKRADLEIIITNRNTTALQLSDLVIDYPEGARSPNDPTRPLTHERISIGTIKSGAQIKHTTSALFYGSEGVTEKILARLEYSVSGSNGVFEKKGETSFTIGSAPVSLIIDAPPKATAGDQFTLDITVRSNATGVVENVAVEGQYPFGFSVIKTEPQAGAGGTIWRLGTLKPGDTKVIRLTGTIEAADGDERVFRFLVGSNSDQTDPHVKVPFLTVPQTLTVERPFITGVITLEGKTGPSVSVSAGKTLGGTIRWENNLPDAISGLELSLSFDGPAVDKASVSAPNGFYQSQNSTIIWTSQGDSSLASVPPGGQGTYQFSFATLPPGANGSLITNPTVTLSLSVRGTRQAEGSSGGSVASAATMKVTLASALFISAQTSRTSGPFLNSGPMPPRAEQNSSYTITWAVKNSANTVANATAQTVLPPYVKFIKGEAGVTYDEGTRMVKWALGDVKAGVGFTTALRQVAFQVLLTPSTSQVGTTPELTGSVLLSGLDRFAQVAVEGSAEASTIRVVDFSGMDTVLPK